MFRKYSSGMFVPCGTYLNTKDWEFHGVAGEGDFLDGEGVTYYRLPLLLVIAMSPLIGLAFVLFLPVAVPAVLIYGIARRLSQSTRGRRARFPRSPDFARRAGSGR
jgi:hypothetical protein